MKLIDLLRRLGILRTGAETATYTNAADRPASLQMEGMFDSEKDLVVSRNLGAGRGQVGDDLPPRQPSGGSGRRP